VNRLIVDPGCGSSVPSLDHLAVSSHGWPKLIVDLTQIEFNTFQPSTYLNSTGLTDDVQWDGYSLFVKGQRIYLYSGEIHSAFNPIPARLSSERS